MSYKEYVLAMRPWSFTAAIVPVAVTTAVVGGSFRSPVFLRAMAMGICIQAGANLTNTYFDFLNGIDNRDTNNGEKTLVDRKVSPLGVIALSILCYTLGVGVILPVLLAKYDIQLLFIVALGVLLAFFYTANPVGLKYKALGDITIFLCFGPLLMQCTSMLLTGSIHQDIYLYSIPIGLLTEGILHANNARDIKRDSLAGAVTFATLLGFDYSYYFYVLLLVGSYLSVAIISVYHHYGCLLAFLTVPLSLNLNNKFIKNDMTTLPEETAQTHLPFGLLLLVGILTTSTGIVGLL